MAMLARRRTEPVAGSGALSTLARVVGLITSVVVGLIVIGIVLVLLEADRANDIVNWLLDAGGWLTNPFHNLFKLDGHKANVAVNWGVAALVYGFVGGLIARLLRR